MSKRVTNAIELVRKMGDNEKRELISLLVEGDLLNEILEDVEDILLFISRKDESATDFHDFLNELRHEGKPV